MCFGSVRSRGMNPPAPWPVLSVLPQPEITFCLLEEGEDVRIQGMRVDGTYAQLQATCLSHSCYLTEK